MPSIVSTFFTPGMRTRKRRLALGGREVTRAAFSSEHARAVIAAQAQAPKQNRDPPFGKPR